MFELKKINIHTTAFTNHAYLLAKIRVKSFSQKIKTKQKQKSKKLAKCMQFKGTHFFALQHVIVKRV